MIVKSEYVAVSDHKYVQFGYTFDARYNTSIDKLSFLSWVMINDCLGFRTV